MSRRVAIMFLLLAVAGCASSAKGAAPTPRATSTTTTTTLPREQVVPARTRFTVDGQAVDLICKGHGRIPVVFLAGGHEIGVLWNALIESLGDDVFTCVFNRPGTTADEWQQPPTELTTPRVVADALAETLEQALLGPQVVLVGHSAGGDSAIVFGADHPLRVAGAVLFDPSVPDLVPPGEWERIGFRRAATIEDVRRVTSWPDVPLVVLTADPKLVVQNHEDTPENERKWVAAHQRYAHFSSEGTQRAVPNTGHFVYLDAPQVATAAVRQVLRAASG